jgi:hypothetical protein
MNKKFAQKYQIVQDPAWQLFRQLNAECRAQDIENWGHLARESATKKDEVCCTQVLTGTK